MDGQVHLASQKRAVDLLCEESFSLQRPQGDIRAEVAFRLDMNQLDRRSAGQRLDQTLDMMGLPQSQCGRPSADAQSTGAHASPSVMNRYPTPHTVRKCLGLAGSRSKRLRRRKMKLSTVRVEGNTS